VLGSLSVSISVSVTLPHSFFLSLTLFILPPRPPPTCRTSSSSALSTMSSSVTGVGAPCPAETQIEGSERDRDRGRREGGSEEGGRKGEREGRRERVECGGGVGEESACAVALSQEHPAKQSATRVSADPEGPILLKDRRGQGVGQAVLQWLCGAALAPQSPWLRLPGLMRRREGGRPGERALCIHSTAEACGGCSVAVRATAPAEPPRRLPAQHRAKSTPWADTPPPGPLPQILHPTIPKNISRTLG
jgi:hypothetical protein